MSSPVRLVVYSDYLCPWCYNAAVRIERLEQEFGADLEVAWQSYLLRPRPQPGRDLERFRHYTRSWLRPAAEPDGGEFQVWQTDEGPPTHSVPPHLAAKAAGRIAPEAFRRLHRRLLRAYFGENRDVSAEATLRELWADVGLPEPAFEQTRDPALLEQVLAEHQEALERGATGVPAARMADDDIVIVGAHPYELYQRWVTRRLGASASRLET